MDLKKKDALRNKLLPVKQIDDQKVKKPFFIELIEEIRESIARNLVQEC